MSRILKMIEKEALTTVFQPIISIDQKKIIGFEALARATGEFADMRPDAMFEAAENNNCLLALDRLCRKKAISLFAASAYRDSFLFLNLDAGIIDQEVLGSRLLYNTVREHGLSPKQIVIEIVESKGKDLPSLIAFIDFYRSQGFTIALDDVGAAYSNLERIAILKPDILKIDRSLISGIDKEFYKREILKSLVTLGKGIGSLIIAEGVESKEEALTALHIGANMLQGYYIQRPETIQAISVENIIGKKENLAIDYRKKVIDHSMTNRKIRDMQHRSMAEIANRFAEQNQKQIPLIIETILSDYEGIECIYVLDEYGLQITPTLFSKSIDKELIRSFYQPGVIGTDHSMKDYYYQTNSNRNFFRTCPYLSKATGKTCITFSKALGTSDDRNCIICIDITDKGPLWQ